MYVCYTPTHPQWTVYSTLAHKVYAYVCLLLTHPQWSACSTLAHEATRDVLKDLIYTLITILLDGRLNELEDGQHVTRSVNVTIVKIVEHADVTNVLR